VRFSAAFAVYAAVIIGYSITVDPAFTGVGVGWAVCGWMSYAAIVGIAIWIAFGLWPTAAAEPTEAARLLEERYF
jgi:hypothetical protein